jgi:release factor glutamine methyltransferase
LIYSATGISKTDLALDPELLADDQVTVSLAAKFAELMRYKPIQYVTGKAYFMGLELEVDPAVLIPRPETEELVRWAADDHINSKGLRILDIGTGSGCIILSLGSLLADPLLTACDISGPCLSTAMINARKLGMDVKFVEMDILDRQTWPYPGNYDLIVSNPPYVRNSEKGAMSKNVLLYEPSVALFVPDEDPLLYYRAIAGFARERLSGKGKVYVEINESFGKEIREIFYREGFTDVIIAKDMQNKERMVRACR